VEEEVELVYSQWKLTGMATGTTKVSKEPTAGCRGCCIDVLLVQEVPPNFRWRQTAWKCPNLDILAGGPNLGIKKGVKRILGGSIAFPTTIKRSKKLFM